MLLKITLFVKRTLYIVDIVDCELANMRGHQTNQNKWQGVALRARDGGLKNVTYRQENI